MTSPTPNQKSCEQVLDEQFPKGQCKERGQALMLFAHFTIALEAEKEVADRWKEQCRATAEGGANNIKLIADLHQKLDMLRDIVHDDVPHQYQTRLLEALKQ